METCLNWCGDRAFISTDDRALISRCLAGIRKHPEECKILAMPADNDGCLYFSCPVEYGKQAIRNLWPRQSRQMSEEQRAAAAARLQTARAKKGRG